MAYLSPEQGEKLKAKLRHEELVAAMRPPDNSNLEKLIADGFAAVKALAEKDTTPDMKPLIAELTKGLAEIKQMKEVKPTSFDVIRGNDGKITRVVVNT